MKHDTSESSLPDFKLNEAGSRFCKERVASTPPLGCEAEKGKPMKHALIVFLLAVQIAAAQQVKVDLVTAAPNFREVGGKLYNVDRSTNWTSITGELVQTVTNGIVIASFREETERVYVPSTLQTPDGNLMLQTGRDAHWVTTGKTNRVDQKTIFILNYPKEPRPTTGSLLRFRAMRAGTMDYGSDVLEAWDYGMPHVVAVARTNAPANK